MRFDVVTYAARLREAQETGKKLCHPGDHRQRPASAGVKGEYFVKTGNRGIREDGTIEDGMDGPSIA